jgi:hypothetical protein
MVSSMKTAAPPSEAWQGSISDVTHGLLGRGLAICYEIGGVLVREDPDGRIVRIGCDPDGAMVVLGPFPGE